MPSLAERREDIALLANHFCAAACARHGRFQKQLLEAALEESDWNVAETARRLDLSRSHFYNLVNAFGLKRKE